MNLERFLLDAAQSALTDVLETLLPIISIIWILLLIVSAMECFYGYKIFRISIAIKGGILGMLLGGIFGMLVLRGNVAEAIIYALLGAFLLGILSYYLYALGVFNSCFFIGTIISFVIFNDFGLAMIIGVILGIIGCIFCKYAIIIITSFIGGAGIGLCMYPFLGFGFGTIIAILCGILGFWIQSQNNVQNKTGDYAKSNYNSAELGNGNEREIEQIKIPSIPPNFQMQNPKNAVPNLFAAKIQDELNYVFSPEVVHMIVQLPNFHEDGTWTCSCGRNCENEVCIVCGMTYDDAKEKLTYQYLDNHYKERINAIAKKQQEEKDEQERLNREKCQKRHEKITTYMKFTKEKLKEMLHWSKKILEKMKYFLVKHKKKIVITITIFIISTGAIYGISQIPEVRIVYYNERAKHSNDISKKTLFYQNSLDTKENIDAYLGLLEVSINTKNYSQSKYYIEILEEKYGGNKDYQNFKNMYKPKAPKCNLADGIYDTWADVSYKTIEGVNIKYQINDMKYQSYITPIKLEQNGKYILTAYAENEYGFKSETVKNHFEINVTLPDKIVCNYESGTYKNSLYLELSQPAGYQIYYTKDGSQPDKHSYAYNGEIECNRGITNIRAICYDDKHISSEVLAIDIIVRSPIQGAMNAVNKGMAESGNAYDYIATNEGLKRYDVSGNYVDIICTDVCHALYFADDTLYFVSQENGIMTYNENTGDISNISKAYPDFLVVLQDKIYYANRFEPLQCMDLSGTHYECNNNIGIYAIDVYDNQIFIANNNKVYKMETDGSYTDLCELPTSDRYIDSIAACADSLYISNGSIYQYFSGTLIEIMTHTTSTAIEEPYKTNNGYVRETTNNYSNLRLNENRLYYTHDTDYDSHEISWLTKENKNYISNSTSTDMIYFPETNTTIPCEESKAIVVDNGYFSYVNDNTIVHKVSY